MVAGVSHSCRPLKLLSCGDFGLQPPVEADALLPLEGVSHVCVVGGHEAFDLLSGDSRISKIRSAEAFATQDRKPDFDKTQPGRMHRQEVEYECSLRMGVQPAHHFGR